MSPKRKHMGRSRRAHYRIIPPHGQCPKGGKVRWPSRAAARQHVKGLLSAGKAGAASRLATYKCAACDGWHVGHRTEGDRGNDSTALR